MHNIRSLIATGTLAIGLAMTSAGCMAPVQAVNAIEQSANQRDFDRSVAVLRAHIKALQDKGDPLGDYFYALGNSDGWITDVTDPKAITALFEKAAAKGSMDAKILLALQEATGEKVPGRLTYLKEPSRTNFDQWERGLTRLEPLLLEQCFARRLAIDTGTPTVTSYSIGRTIWPKFRDGYYRYNTDGSRTFLKGDPSRQRLWEDIDRNCKVPTDVIVHS